MHIIVIPEIDEWVVAVTLFHVDKVENLDFISLFSKKISDGSYLFPLDGMSRGTSKFFSFDYCLRASSDAIFLSTSTGVIVEISASLASTVKVVFPILISRKVNSPSFRSV